MYIQSENVSQPFSIMWIPKLLLTPAKIRNFGPKNSQIWPKNGIFGQILAFWPIWSHAKQNKVRTRCIGGFSVRWVPRLLLPPVKNWFFVPKTTKFGPKLAFLVILGQALPAHLVPCWLVGWWLWRAGCISQDTYLLYSYLACSWCFTFCTQWELFIKCWCVVDE